MPKFKNVTAAELDALQVEAQDAQADAADYCHRLEQGYCDTLPEPLRRASAFFAVSQVLADLAHQLLLKAVREEREFEAMLRARQKEEAP